MYLNKIVLEITRKCNISCEHCLRGEPENIDMDKSIIDVLLSQVSEIHAVTFTGGEPSLNLPLMRYFLEQIKGRNIGVDYFFIATNGIKIHNSFIQFCQDLYDYCSLKKSCGVEISNDYYHLAQCMPYDADLITKLPFITKRYKESEAIALLAEGRAAEESKGLKVIEYAIDDIYSFDEADIYVNVNGRVLNGCNWSYESQEKDDHFLCDVQDLKKYYEQLN